MEAQARYKVGDKIQVADHIKGFGWDYLRQRELIVKVVHHWPEGILYGFGPGFSFALLDHHAA